MQSDPLLLVQAALGDRYRVERFLGSGGTAIVYLAHDSRHDRLVAIKVLRFEVAHALGPDRFLREIRIAANLNHPHILPLHDSGEADGLLLLRNALRPGNRSASDSSAIGRCRWRTRSGSRGKWRRRWRTPTGTA